MPTRLTGLPSLASLGVEAPQPPNLVSLNRAPTVNDFANFNTGDLWLNTASLLGANPMAPTAEDVWMLVSKNKRIANATWINFGGGGSLLSLTGNTGGTVFGDPAQNINTLGDGVGITVVGNPATHTLTWSLVGGGVATQSYLTDDAQVEVPNAAGQLTVTGTGVLSAGNVYSNLSTLRGINVNTVGTVLNSSVGQPNTTANGLEGVYALGPNNNYITDRFLHNYGTSNTFLGNLSGNMTLTVANATFNTCIGYGTGNHLVGTAATNAALNTLVGSLAGQAITNSSGCTYIGSSSGLNTTTPLKNVGVGLQSLGAATTGTGQNTAAGSLSGVGLLTGNNNCFYGYNSGSNYTGAESGNVVIGSGNLGRTGESGWIRIGSAPGGDIFIGFPSGNTTYTVGTSAFNNALGPNTLTALTVGRANCAHGNGVLQAMDAGNDNNGYGNLVLNMANSAASSRNNGYGNGALTSLLTGSDNSCFGDDTGGAFTTNESWNICIGSGGGAANVGVTGDNSVLRIGVSTNATPGGGVLSKAFIQGIRGITTGNANAIAVLIDSAGQLGTVSSTKTVKDNINDMGPYSDVLYDLRPVTFNYKQHSPGIISVGLIAEEVEQVMPRLVAYQEDKPMSVKYHDLPAMLLNELQKLEKRVRELEAKI